MRAWKPTATVELHFNAVENPAERPDLKGSLVLFGAEDSRRWAQTLQDMMVALYNRQGPRENQGIHIPGPENGYKRGRRNVYFAEFERSMIQERVRAGLKRAVDEGKQLGRPLRSWKPVSVTLCGRAKACARSLRGLASRPIRF